MTSYGPVLDQPPCASMSPGWNVEDSKFVPHTSASAAAGATAIAAITAPEIARPRNLPTGLAMARASAISRRSFIDPPCRCARQLASQRYLAIQRTTGTRDLRDVKRSYYAINRAVQPFIDSRRRGAS